jgi:non-heme chloroperoxidase
MVQADANPGGLPKSVFDDLQAQLAANRSEFYRALPSGRAGAGHARRRRSGRPLRRLAFIQS